MPMTIQNQSGARTDHRFRLFVLQVTADLGHAIAPDTQDFETRILDAAVKATPEEQVASKSIVNKVDVTSVETIMPVIAALLFVELNKHNRDFSLSKAQVYAQQMTLGYWRLIH
jgi:hypothetical protein